MLFNLGGWSRNIEGRVPGRIIKIQLSEKCYLFKEVGVEGIEGGVPGRIMKIQLGEIPNFVLEPEDMTTEVNKNNYLFFFC